MIKHDPYINRIIFSEYLIQKKIGKGSFGTVYQGKVVSTDQKIAIKLEKKEKDDSGLLETEACRLYLMQGEGIPKIICYGNNQTHNILIQELLGHSLEELFNLNGRKFTLKTVCSIGIEMIKRIKFVHSKYHIHRDIKPDNFMTGREKEDNKIYIIDFGLAKKYYSVSKKSHIKFRTGKNLIGTARYCGRNAHKGYEQGRRDDIESIGYVLMYFLNGILPWQGLKAMKGEDQFEKIAEKKNNTSFEELTRNNPEEFLLYFKHCDSLKFEDEPNYEYLISLFKTMINKYCIDCLYDYDWKKNKIPNLSSIKDKEINNNKDISLLVHNNISAIESKGEGKEEINNNIKLKKDVFIGEDKNENELKERILKRNKSSNLLNGHSLIKENLEMNIDDNNKKNNDSKNDNINNNDININNNNNVFSISNISPQNNNNIKGNNFNELLNKKKINNYRNYNLNKKIIKKEYFFTYDQNMVDMVKSNKSTIKEDYNEENNYKINKPINRFQQPKKLENIFTEEDIKSEEINDINDENEKDIYKKNNNNIKIQNSFINSKVKSNNINNRITNFQFNISENKKDNKNDIKNEENNENNHTHRKEHHNHHNHNHNTTNHTSHNHSHHHNKNEDNHNNNKDEENNKSNSNNLSTDANNINSDKNIKEMKEKKNDEEEKKEENDHKNNLINQKEENLNDIKMKRRNRVKSVDNKIKKNNPGCYCFIF